MKRIGLIASHVAKGNLLVYNGYVFLLSVLVSSIIFFMSGFALLVGLALMALITQGVIVFEPGTGFTMVFKVGMAALAVLTGMINLVAIFMNLKLK